MRSRGLEQKEGDDDEGDDPTETESRMSAHRVQRCRIHRNHLPF